MATPSSTDATTTGFTCTKCGSHDYSRNEMRAEGGFWSAAFDVATNRFFAVSCTRCGFTELYRQDTTTGSKFFDFLVSQQAQAASPA